LTNSDIISIIKTVIALALPYHPKRLNAPRSPLIQNLLDLVVQSKQDCVDKIISMLEDFHLHGFQKDTRGAYACRFIKPFGGAIYELKAKKVPSGAARVYLIRGNDQCAYLTHAECKNQNAAHDWMIANTLEIQDALEQNFAVFPEPQQSQHFARIQRILEDL
jgi:hypothetical protein